MIKYTRKKQQQKVPLENLNIRYEKALNYIFKMTILMRTGYWNIHGAGVLKADN